LVLNRKVLAFLHHTTHSPDVANNLKKIKNIFKILLLLLSIQAFSQKFEMKIDSILNIEIADLKASEVNEIGYTKLTCVNYGVSSTVYLIWKKDNSTFIQKFKNSEYNDKSFKKFKPIKITDSTFFEFYNQNKEKLNNENIEYFEYKPDSIAGNKIYSSRITTSHSCFRHFVIKSDKEDFDKQFDYFVLKEFDQKKVYASKRKYTEEEIKEWEERGWEGMEYEIIHENYPKRNLNFEYNKKSKIVEWDKNMTEVIKKLESEDEFELIRTQ